MAEAARNLMVVKVIAVSGHFGSGKTTLLLRLLALLMKEKLKVGVILNDVGHVDFELFTSKSNCLVKNISKHCLCVKGHDLKEALKKLLESQVDVILTEAIGFSDPYKVWTTISDHISALKCNFEINLVTVLVDGDFFLNLHRKSKSRISPAIANQMQWIAPEHFPEAINNIVLQQLSEADIIVVNKCDLLSSHTQAIIKELIRNINNEAKVHFISATLGSGVEDLYSDLMGIFWARRPPKTQPKIAKQRMEALLEMRWFNYEVYLSLQRKRLAQSVGKEIMNQLLVETFKRIKDGENIFRVKIHGQFEEKPNELYVSLTPDLKMDIYSYPDELKFKNGKFAISFVVKKMDEEVLVEALNSALSGICSNFNIS
ncbi:MAG: GTP-binding protein [Candidatus Bathyarchaeia archaeon]